MLCLRATRISRAGKQLKKVVRKCWSSSAPSLAHEPVARKTIREENSASRLAERADEIQDDATELRGALSCEGEREQARVALLRWGARPQRLCL